MATLQRFARSCRQILKTYARCRSQLSLSRTITTSGKNKDAASHAHESLVEKSQELKDLEAHFGDTDPTKLKNWQSYGWDHTDREHDTWHANISNFSLFTLCLVGAGYLFLYAPDFDLRDWATREAYLELERREKAGLPLIDPYLISPEQVELPSEEEIGDQEIII